MLLKLLSNYVMQKDKNDENYSSIVDSKDEVYDKIVSKLQDDGNFELVMDLKKYTTYKRALVFQWNS
jgi:hypothetical protein